MTAEGTVRFAEPDGGIAAIVLDAGATPFIFGENQIRQLAEVVRLIAARTDVTGVVITFSNRAVELTGAVQTADLNDLRGRREIDATVVAVPSDYETAFAAGMLTLRSVTGRIEPDGSYRLQLPFAGDYLVVALPPEVEPALDDRFFQTWLPRATRVSVVEGQPASLTLTMSRSR